MQHQLSIPLSTADYTVETLGQEIRDTYLLLRGARREWRKSQRHLERMQNIERHLVALQTLGYKMGLEAQESNGASQ